MRNITKIVTTLSLLVNSYTLSASELIATASVLTLDGAKVIAAAAAKKAQAENWQVVIVISDAAGDVKYLERMENVQLASLDIAINKAKTAVMYRRATQSFSERLNSGSVAIPTLPNMMPLTGGIPIKVNGQLIGAVGVSGVKGIQDAEIAQAGIDALLKQLGK